jgi:hypothetical protein
LKSCRIHKPDEPPLRGAGAKKVFKNSQRIKKRPTDKNIKWQHHDEKDIEWFCPKLFIKGFNRITATILPKSVGRFSIRWR